MDVNTTRAWRCLLWHWNALNWHLCGGQRRNTVSWLIDQSFNATSLSSKRFAGIIGVFDRRTESQEFVGTRWGLAVHFLLLLTKSTKREIYKSRHHRLFTICLNVLVNSLALAVLSFIGWSFLLWFKLKIIQEKKERGFQKVQPIIGTDTKQKALQSIKKNL